MRAVMPFDEHWVVAFGYTVLQQLSLKKSKK